MMKKVSPIANFGLTFSASLLLLAPFVSANAQDAAKPAATAPADAAAKSDAVPTQANRAQAYYHLALASVYEDDAISDGHTDSVNRAIEEY